MDMNPAAAGAALSMSAPTSLSAGTSVLKTAIDTQAEAARQLMESVQQTAATEPARLPPNLGQNINVTA
jgi:hypothetical protein